jgi:hypothetical protein
MNVRERRNEFQCLSFLFLSLSHEFLGEDLVGEDDLRRRRCGEDLVGEE